MRAGLPRPSLLRRHLLRWRAARGGPNFRGPDRPLGGPGDLAGPQGTVVHAGLEGWRRGRQGAKAKGQRSTERVSGTLSAVFRTESNFQVL